MADGYVALYILGGILGAMILISIVQIFRRKRLNKLKSSKDGGYSTITMEDIMIEELEDKEKKQLDRVKKIQKVLDQSRGTLVSLRESKESLTQRYTLQYISY